ncbi:response regulator transcription factor [Prescottella sp. R16]|uniref:response regulator transcription factor n=1 Tax=Prescottella sp. R16 TaxID=3064529 RepID=UPI00272DE064|nr:response regulator transcription factor [Prescottella sp. R16]
MRGTAPADGHNARVTAIATVLVVDDDPDVLASLERGLRLSGFDVLTAGDGAAALQVVDAAAPDVVVLDMNMPVLDGTGVVTALRERGNEIPICVLSARSSVDDRIAGLESGADDYLVKPFVLAELVARIRAMLRRRSTPDTTPAATGEQIVVGPLSIDVAGRRVHLGGTEIGLTKREFELVEVLARNAGVVLSRERLLELVWGYDFAADTNVVDVFVGYLRRKFEADGTPRLVHTVRGVGFVVREPT